MKLTKIPQPKGHLVNQGAIFKLSQPTIVLPLSLSMPNAKKIKGIVIQALVGHNGAPSVTTRMRIYGNRNSILFFVSLGIMRKKFEEEISLNGKEGFE